MGKRAARIRDNHTCLVTTPVPHIGGPIIGPGATSVLIEGVPAAVKGDRCSCIGVPDTILTGSSGVWIEGRPAARIGDGCAHGGLISTGCTSVLIGGTMAGEVDDSVLWAIYEKKDGTSVRKQFRRPSPARRIKLINQAIQDAAALLASKQRLLRKRDLATMKLFKKWFGRDDEKAIKIIRIRIKKELKLIRSLNESHFIDIADRETRQATFGMVYPDDQLHIISLGNPFWEAEAVGPDSRAGTLIHELSHFLDIGGTVDHQYGEIFCLELAKYEPDKALFNADNFEYFIEA
jgi:uncharacterized Zn-binding protein involved in type VI secretion